jgi:hypothetical protein
LVPFPSSFSATSNSLSVFEYDTNTLEKHYQAHPSFQHQSYSHPSTMRISLFLSILGSLSVVFAAPLAEPNLKSNLIKRQCWVDSKNLPHCRDSTNTICHGDDCEPQLPPSPSASADSATPLQSSTTVVVASEPVRKLKRACYRDEENNYHCTDGKEGICFGDACGANPTETSPPASTTGVDRRSLLI